MSQIQIRSIRTEEWDTVTALVWKTFLQFEAGDYPEEGIHKFLEFISDERLKKLHRLGEYPVYAAFLDEKMIGVISLRSRNHISLLFVLGEYHRRGIGSALLETMKEYVLAEGKEKVLTVDSSPYAVGFYHKNGFTDTEPVQRRDGIIYTPMQCSLSP